MAQSERYELVGGPMDGMIHDVPSGVERFVVFEQDKRKPYWLHPEAGASLKAPDLIEHVYLARKVNGIRTRQRTGLFAMDYQGISDA